MAKVWLLNPPHPQGKGFTREGRCTQEASFWATQWPPVTLATIAAMLDRDGHQVKAMDCPAIGMPAARLRPVLSREQPDFVFWNTATPTLQADLELAALVKAACPTACTGVLGTHVTALPAAALENPAIDLVIRGEPEETVQEVCRAGRSGWKDILGLSFREERNGKIRHNPDRPLLPPAAIPAPAWEHLDLSVYRLPLKRRPFLIVAPIRGCPFPCSFCTAPIYYGRKLRKRPIRAVIDEIEDDMARFKVRDFFMWADTFTADRNYVLRFCHEIKARGLKILWTCNSRVDTIDRDMLLSMKSAGLWMISFGLESGHEAILKRTGKRITPAQSRRAVELAHACGIKTSGHFILGLPGESEETLRQTLGFALQLPLDIAQFYAAAPFPGTPLFQEAQAKGWLRSGEHFSQSRAGMDLPGLPAERVEAFRRRAYLRFYLRPKALAKLGLLVVGGAG